MGGGAFFSVRVKSPGMFFYSQSDSDFAYCEKNTCTCLGSKDHLYILDTNIRKTNIFNRFNVLTPEKWLNTNGLKNTRELRA